MGKIITRFERGPEGTKLIYPEDEASINTILVPGNILDAISLAAKRRMDYENIRPVNDRDNALRGALSCRMVVI